MKKAILFSCVLMAVTSTATYAQPPRIAFEVIVGTRPPAPNELQMMRAEEELHPRITQAMRPPFWKNE